MSFLDIMSTKFVGRRITIRQDQARWLDENPEISLSGLTQKAIDKLNIGRDNQKMDILRAIYDRNPGPSADPRDPPFFNIGSDILGNLLRPIGLNDLIYYLGELQEMGYVETKGAPSEEVRLTTKGQRCGRKIKENCLGLLHNRP